MNNLALDKTYTFVYNKGGNIVSKNEYAYTEGMIEGEPTKTYNISFNLPQLIKDFINLIQ